MQFLQIIGFSACAALNILTSKLGYNNIFSGDKDISLPFSAMIFLFYPLLIYLPEAHYKFIVFGDSRISVSEKEHEEEQDLPWAYILTLLCITCAIIVHRLIIFNKDLLLGNRNSDQNTGQQIKKNRRKNKNIEYHAESIIIKYYLSLAIGLQNIASAFYITIQEDQDIIRNQFIIFGVFSLFINFSYGYLNGWSAITKKLHLKLTYFINVEILLGFILGLIVSNNYIMLALPCLCCGLMIYCCALVALPLLFSSGQNQTQDKFRYGSIFTSLLMTVIYHPFCYLLRV